MNSTKAKDMNLGHRKFFIGLMHFFSILLPGALLTYLLMGEASQSCWGIGIRLSGTKTK